MGSICCSLFNLQLTSHTQYFRNPFATLSNKVSEVYFSKEVCSFVIIVNYVSACICIRIVVSRLCNTNYLPLPSLSVLNNYTSINIVSTQEVLVEMDTATRVQIRDRANFISHSTYTLEKGINPIILPPAMGT